MKADEIVFSIQNLGASLKIRLTFHESTNLLNSKISRNVRRRSNVGIDLRVSIYFLVERTPKLCFS